MQARSLALEWVEEAVSIAAAVMDLAVVAYGNYDDLFSFACGSILGVQLYHADRGSSLIQIDLRKR